MTDTKPPTNDMNPRVALWAKLKGIDPTKLVRKDKTKPLFEVGGYAWTIQFTSWIARMWPHFYRECHGNEQRGECCASASMDGSFDKWLAARVEALMENDDG